jgi:hypothetical protein
MVYTSYNKFKLLTDTLQCLRTSIAIPVLSQVSNRLPRNSVKRAVGAFRCGEVI